MTITLLVESDTDREQRLMMPGTYNWLDFEALEALMAASTGLRITYMDGSIELTTLGESHEQIKSLIGMFLEAYFIANNIEFIPIGSAPRRSEDQGISFEPDESYCLGTKKENPDLAIEVVLTSSSLAKLTKYHRFQIPEVWLWEDNQLQVHQLTADSYKLVKNSILLPKLDLTLLVRCIQMPSRLEAMKAFIAGVQHG